jgi:hypothetical protein
VDLSFLTPELFNAIIIANLVIAVVLVLARYTRDMTRPLPPAARRPKDDTHPNPRS